MSTPNGDSEETMVMKDKLLEIPVGKIALSKYDVRKYPEDKDEFNSLKQSIGEEGLVNPLTVIGQKDGTYLLVAGRRRFKACTELGMKKVPVFVKSDNSVEWENDLISVIENLHRRELKDGERSYGILHAYEIAGYTKEEAFKGTEYLHNHPELLSESSLLDTTKSNKPKQKRQTKGFKPDKKFLQVCKKIGYSPVWQSKLLQLTRNIEEETLKKADTAGLSTQKKIMLAHPRLQKHPRIQNVLVKRLAERQSQTDAQDRVSQTILDLDTGYLSPSKTGEEYVYGGINRDTIKGNKQEAKGPEEHYLDVVGNCDKLLQSLTGHKLTRGEFHYSKEIIENSRAHRLNIVKNYSDYRTLNTLNSWSLQMVKLAIDDMIKIVDEELDVLDDKNEMAKK